MATIATTVTAPVKNVIISTWTPLANGDVGVALFYPQHADRNVQVFGTFGVGGSIKLEGSSNGSNWDTLKDMDNADVVFTAAGTKMVRENAPYIRPSVTAGDGTTALTAVVTARKPT
jgi:hypothetical protein